MKHICFITQGFSRQDSLIVQRQGKSLAEAGYRVSYILCDGKPKEVIYGIEMLSIDTNMGGLIYRLCCTHRHLLKIYKYFIFSGRIKSFLKDYDAEVFQINDFEQLPIGFFLKNHGKTVVYNLREYYPDFRSRKLPFSFLRKISFKLIERYLTKVAKRFDGVFNCMPEMHDYIKKIMPCKHFEDVANFPVINKNFRLTFEEYSKRENVISYFGTIYHISCQDEFLDALANISNIRYLLAGIWAIPADYERIKKHPAWNKVEFINGFKREELPGIINCSIMGNVMKDFSMTETPEGSYSIIKIFETMEAAVPVILSRVPLYEKMVEKYHCGICVNPRDPKEIKGAIEYLLNNKREAYEMGQNGRRAVLEEFSWDSQWMNYFKIIKELSEQTRS